MRPKGLSKAQVTVVLANSINRPGEKGAVLVRCMNPTSQPLELPADLLTRYEAVFSKNDQDVGRTELVYYSISTTKGTRPIRQPPHRLGPHKEQEAERQVQDLLARGLIKPANGAWSSPVVLVRKKKPVLAVLRGLQEAERGYAARCVPPTPHR